MKQHILVSILVAACVASVAVASTISAQGRSSAPTSVKPGEPQSEIARLSAEVARLQSEINRLTSDLAACRNQIQAAPPTDSKKQDDSETRLREATVALRGLVSVTTAGLAYSEYTRRLLDVRILVDRAAPPSDRPIPVPYLNLRKAMDLYEFAGKVWSAKIRDREQSELGADPRLALCPAARERAVAAYDASLLGAGLALVGIPPLWTCAADAVSQLDAK